MFKEISKLSKENKLKLLAVLIQVLGISFTTIKTMMEESENRRLRKARARRRPTKKLKSKTTVKKEKPTNNGTTKRPATPN